METIFERVAALDVAALDVHKAQVTACVRVPDPEGRREPPSRGVLANRGRVDDVA
jgi:hypothetical protein